MSQWHDYVLPALLLLPLAGAVVLLVAGPRADSWAVGWGVAVQGLGLLVALAMLAGFDTSKSQVMQFEVNAEWVPQLDLSIHLGVDGISLPLVVLTSLLGLLTTVYSVRFLPEPGRPRAFIGLLLVLQVGMLGTFVALNLVLFFVFFEVVLVPMWFLIAFWGQGEKRSAANLFILYTVLGSIVMLVGFLLVWVQTGTTDMVELAAAHGLGLTSTTQLAAVLLIGVGLAVKTPMWPLHSWLPDAHTAAPTVGSVLLAGVLLKMGTYGMVRIALPVLPSGAADVAPYLAVLAVIGILYGAWASFGQRDLKRLIAFSSVGHMGFVLFGISTLDPIGVNAALFGNIAHGLITGLLFFIVGGLKIRTHTTALRDLPRGLYQRAPRLGFLLGFACVAGLGLPGLAGFWGEFLALLGAYNPFLPQRLLYRCLLVLAALGMVLTAVYFLRVMRRVGQGKPDEEPIKDVSEVEAASWVPLAALILALGIFPGVLLSLTAPSVEQVLSTPVVLSGAD
ncbi:MAG TPA: NADH-quinone oxidoreductase subunit M [Actinomycetes bacterium]|nr:NADH-quinone oxidoreductase subunit M [Actinomycetes bacterium]